MEKFDVIKKILQENEFLKPKYYEILDIYSQGNVEKASFSRRLHSLANSIASQISDNQLPLQSLINILEQVEEYLVSFNDEGKQADVEIMFFETLLNTMSHISEDEPRYRYISLFQNNLGPASEDLCKKNNEFWTQITH